MNTTQKDIENAIKVFKGFKDKDFLDWSFTAKEFREAITTVLTTLEAVEKAELKLPEKLRPTHNYNYEKVKIGAFNECLNLCTPAVAKPLLEIKELKLKCLYRLEQWEIAKEAHQEETARLYAELHDLKKEVHTQQCADEKDFDDYKAQVAKLEGIVKAQARKIKELEGTKERNIKHILQLIKDKEELKQLLDDYTTTQKQIVKELQAQLEDDKDGCIKSCAEVAELIKDNDDLREQLHNKVFQAMQENERLTGICIKHEKRIWDYEKQAKLKRSSMSVEEIEKIILNPPIDEITHRYLWSILIPGDISKIAQALFNAINTKEK